jgi:hypothetical protein
MINFTVPPPVHIHTHTSSFQEQLYLLPPYGPHPPPPSMQVPCPEGGEIFSAHASSPCCISTAVHCWSRCGPSLSSQSSWAAESWQCSGLDFLHPLSSSHNMGCHVGRFSVWKSTLGWTNGHGHACTHWQTNTNTDMHTHTRASTGMLKQLRLHKAREKGTVCISGSFQKLSSMANHSGYQYTLGNGVWCYGQTWWN